MLPTAPHTLRVGSATSKSACAILWWHDVLAANYRDWRAGLIKFVVQLPR
jgi:hypothetical protein